MDELSQKSQANGLSADQLAQLNDLENQLTELKDSTDNDQTKDQIAKLTEQIDGLQAAAAGPRGATGATGSQGDKGEKGADGSDGATGATGPAGPSGTATCDYGDCLSLQGSSPGMQETGSINISDNAIIGGSLTASSLSGNGSGLSSLNASQLTSGTVNDSRLSANVALLNATQTFSGAVTFSAIGTALNVTNGAQFGTITVTGNASVGSLVFGTTISGSCAGLTGYVWVPGSAKFGTMPGFCVMQYEAKDDGSGNAISQAGTTPWVSISQRTAQDKSRAACSGCHLISENEWMTIAENALWVDANWSGGTVGSGCLFRGNVGNDDACGYNGSDPESGAGRNAKAKLTLSNGVELWDIAGNVWEWTDGLVNAAESPSDGTAPDATGEWLEYTAITQYKGLNYLRPPVDNWNASQGLGRLYTDEGDTGIRAFLRGGAWASAAGAGAFALFLGSSPTDTGTNFGFRVAR